MTEPKFGTLQLLEPAKVWGDERKFSSWLANNFDVLSKEIHIEVEDLEVETKIGPFQCDITGRERETSRPVVVENQYGSSDHDHLGKLMTYAAGMDAGICIWIATEFRDEHLSVLDWLNENTVNEVAFFGVKLEVMKIDRSDPVVLCKIMSKPDEWRRIVRQDGLTVKGKAYIEYFGQVLGRLKSEVPGFTTATRALPQSWFMVGAGKTGVAFTLAFTRDLRYKVEVYITTGDRERNKEIFDRLHAQKSEIESITGPLDWERMDDKKDSRIALYRDNMEVLQLLEDEEKLEETLRWSVENARKFKEAFSPHIQSL